jgi:hypothetical protein
LTVGHMAGEDTGRGFHVGTASGRPYWPLDPQEEDIHLPDLPIQLSRICRFNGALRPDIAGVYTVAQHLCYAHDVAPTELKLEALMHDAHEAYVHDIVKPLKLGLPDYQDVERLNEIVLRRKIGLPKKPSPEVKEIDKRLFATEKRDLCPKEKPGLNWGKLAEPYPFTIKILTPMRARREMIARMKDHGLI